jgi:hypothetical protein
VPVFERMIQVANTRIALQKNRFTTAFGESKNLAVTVEDASRKTLLCLKRLVK